MNGIKNIILRVVGPFVNDLVDESSATVTIGLWWANSISHRLLNLITRNQSVFFVDNGIRLIKFYG